MYLKVHSLVPSSTTHMLQLYELVGVTIVELGPKKRMVSDFSNSFSLDMLHVIQCVIQLNS